MSVFTVTSLDPATMRDQINQALRSLDAALLRLDTDYSKQVVTDSGVTNPNPNVVPGGTVIGDGTITSEMLIDGIVTELKIANAAITEAKIAANSIPTVALQDYVVSVDKLATNSVTSSKIVAGNIQTAHMAAGSIAADRLVANSITTAQIQALAITVNEIAAITAWAKQFTISTGGYINSGQTAYNTGSGFWLGKVGGVTKFSLGDPTGNFMTWDGSVLTLNGSMTIQGTIPASQVTGLASVATSGSYSSLTGLPNLTKVDASGNYTGTIAATSVSGLAAVATSGTLAAGSVSGLHAVATSGLFSALSGKPNVTYIDATGIYTGTLLASQVIAASILASDLGALNAEFGAVKITTNGSFRSGQTAYNTGTGFWLGSVAGVPKFSIGVAGGNGLTWDGTNLAIKGSITLTNTIAATSVTGLAAVATGGTISASSVTGLAAVATSGTLTAANVSGLAAIATSGAYSSLTGVPNTTKLDASGNYTGGVSAASVSGLANVATSGLFSALSGAPNVTYIDSSGIYTGTLLAGQVIAATVLAANLGALNAELGAVLITTNGSLRSGQTAYNTGTGFWLGSVAGVPKFSLGVSTGNYLTWDGTNLTIKGSLTLANTIPASSVTGLAGVATTGVISAANVTGLAGVATSGTLAAANVSGLAAVATSGTLAAGSVTGLAIVATSGVYTDLTSRPNTSKLNASGDYTGSVSAMSVTGLASVATSGLFSALSGAPNVTYIDSTGIYTGTLLAGQVIAATVLAANLGALNAELGAVLISSGGSLRSGQTAYNTGVGFWLGSVSGTPKFSIGNPSGNYLTWDGTNLNLKGAITIVGTVPAASVSGLAGVATTGTLAAANVTGLDSVATGGSIPAARVTGLAGVATSGTLAAASVTGLATVATTGGYASLSGTPNTTLINGAGIYTGSIIATQLAVGSIGAREIAAKSITTAKLLVAPQSICPDPYMSDEAFWTEWINGAPGFDTNNGSNGVAYLSNVPKAIVFAPGCLAGSYIKSAVVAFNGEGQTLRLRATILNYSNNTTGTATVQFFNAAGASLGTYSVVGGPNSLAVQTGQVTVPVGCATLCFWASVAASPNGYISVGAIKLDVCATAELVVDGSITANKISAITSWTKQLTIDTAGYINSGQGSFDSGTGFYLGNVGGVPKFSIGNSGGNKLTWNGTSLNVVADSLTLGKFLLTGSDNPMGGSGWLKALAKYDTSVTPISLGVQSITGTSVVDVGILTLEGRSDYAASSSKYGRAMLSYNSLTMSCGSNLASIATNLFSLSTDSNGSGLFRVASVLALELLPWMTNVYNGLKIQQAGASASVSKTLTSHKWSNYVTAPSTTASFTFSVNISTYGFTAKPNWGFASALDSRVIMTYRDDLSSSTTAYFEARNVITNFTSGDTVWYKAHLELIA